jgi:hypothetical protein
MKEDNGYRDCSIDGKSDRCSHFTKPLYQTSSALLDQTIRDIHQTDRVFDRTIQQIEMSLRVLEDSSRRIESERRAYAIRMVRLLSPPDRLA